MVRLDKWLCNRTSYSRKEIKAIVRDGKVRVDGETVNDPGSYVHTGARVECMGELLSGETHVYIMQNKPAGVVSVSSSPVEQTVIDLLPEQLYRKGLFPAGRLDKDTTGFVLITDDGDFAHRILSPKRHVLKTYTAVLRDPAQPSYAEAFKNGIQLSDGTQCLSAKLEFTEDARTVRVYLREGKYHQVRRMFASLGNPVVSLNRDAIGGLPLDSSLSPGESRLLTESEVKKIIEGDSRI